VKKIPKGFIRPDGDIRYIGAHAIVQRDDSGKALRMIGKNWDITAQKNAEEKLRLPGLTSMLTCRKCLQPISLMLLFIFVQLTFPFRLK
jgi:hypothetical protein